MKDIPHHMKKLNRHVIRDAQREEAGAESYPPFTQSDEEKRKIEKREMKKERNEHVPQHPTEDQRNQDMKHRAPIFDRNNAAPKHGKSSKKKTPPL